MAMLSSSSSLMCSNRDTNSPDAPLFPFGIEFSASLSQSHQRPAGSRKRIERSLDSLLAVVISVTSECFRDLSERTLTPKESLADQKSQSAGGTPKIRGLDFGRALSSSREYGPFQLFNSGFEVSKGFISGHVNSHTTSAFAL
jgi:hypothetical protein